MWYITMSDEYNVIINIKKIEQIYFIDSLTVIILYILGLQRYYSCAVFILVILF